MPKKSDTKKTFFCEYCTKGYVFQSGVSSHMKKAHPEIYLLRKSKRGNFTRTDPSITRGTCDLDLTLSISDSKYLKEYIQDHNIDLGKDLILQIVDILKGQIQIKDGKIYYLEDDSIKEDYISDELVRSILESYTKTIMDMIYDKILAKEILGITQFNKIAERYIGLDQKMTVGVIRCNLEKNCRKDLLLEDSETSSQGSITNN